MKADRERFYFAGATCDVETSQYKGQSHYMVFDCEKNALCAISEKKLSILDRTAPGSRIAADIRDAVMQHLQDSSAVNRYACFKQLPS
jgi:hypothetical protein